MSNGSGTLQLLLSSQVMTYYQFLHGIDARLLGALEPIDVLRFWRTAGGIKDGEPWLAIFCIDEVPHTCPAGAIGDPPSSHDRWLCRTSMMLCSLTLSISFAHMRSAATCHAEHQCCTYAQRCAVTHQAAFFASAWQRTS
jgi:hypothetical protein